MTKTKNTKKNPATKATAKTTATANKKPPKKTNRIGEPVTAKPVKPKAQKLGASDIERQAIENQDARMALQNRRHLAAAVLPSLIEAEAIMRCALPKPFDPVITDHDIAALVSLAYKFADVLTAKRAPAPAVPEAQMSLLQESDAAAPVSPSWAPSPSGKARSELSMAEIEAEDKAADRAFGNGQTPEPAPCVTCEENAKLRTAAITNNDQLAARITQLEVEAAHERERLQAELVQIRADNHALRADRERAVDRADELLVGVRGAAEALKLARGPEGFGFIGERVDQAQEALYALVNGATNGRASS